MNLYIKKKLEVKNLNAKIFLIKKIINLKINEKKKPILLCNKIEQTRKTGLEPILMILKTIVLPLNYFPLKIYKDLL